MLDPIIPSVTSSIMAGADTNTTDNPSLNQADDKHACLSCSNCQCQNNANASTADDTSTATATQTTDDTAGTDTYTAETTGTTDTAQNGANTAGEQLKTLSSPKYEQMLDNLFGNGDNGDTKPPKKRKSKLTNKQTTKKVRKKRTLTKSPKPYKQRFDWGSVDWHKSDDEIAEQLNCHKNSVRSKRLNPTYNPEKINVEPKRGKYLPNQLWDTVDWSESNQEIYQKLQNLLSLLDNLGVQGYSLSVGSIAQKRLRLFGVKNENRANWVNADWSKDDVTLAVETGLTVRYVRSRRRIYEKLLAEKLATELKQVKTTADTDTPA